MPSTIETTLVHDGFSTISDIDVDPRDPNHVVFCTSGLNGNVFESFSAAVTLNSTSFSFVTGDLPQMPIYNVMIDQDFVNTGLILIGTEYGVFGTENSSHWEDISGPIGCAPVYEIRQNWRGWQEGGFKTGEIYIATFGNGIWSSDSYLTDNDNP